jgi:hypothetical protein
VWQGRVLRVTKTQIVVTNDATGDASGRRFRVKDGTEIDPVYGDRKLCPRSMMHALTQVKSGVVHY